MTNQKLGDPVPARSWIVLAILFLGSLSLAGCISARRTPNLERIFARARLKTGKRPVIVIPGILGSQLINSKTGEVVWPSAIRSTDPGSTLPMTPDLAANRDNVMPGKIVETLKLARALPEVYVYRDLLEALRQYGGYREGDWNNPGANGDQDAFYVFAYDWRRDNVESARDLIKRIDSLKEKLQRPDLRFNILAHSMGGLVARYAAMYGDTDLPPAGIQPRPDWSGAARIHRIIMFGVPNEGSADAFATLLEGYSITEGLRHRIPLLNKITAEDAVTAPALFQLMPHGSVARFLDENLDPLQIDLYDPAVWKHYGWSPINNAEFRRRYADRKRLEGAPGGDTLQNLDDYLGAVLYRAKRFQGALDAVAGAEAPVSLLAIGGDCEETLNAPVIRHDEKHDRWVTLIAPREYKTSNGQRITSRQVTDAMFAPGDGRITRHSLLGEDLPGLGPAGSLFRSPLALTYALFGCDLHGALQKNKTLEDNALTALVSEAMK